MPSGYDQSPDYGGPPETWRSIVGAVLLFCIVAAPFIYFTLSGSSEPKCEVVPAADVGTIDANGKAHVTFDTGSATRDGPCLLIVP